MKKKLKIAVILVCILVCGIIVFGAINSRRDKTRNADRNNYLQTHYIFDKKFLVKMTGTDFSKDKYNFQGLITADTLRYFRFLDRKFELKSIDALDDHYHQIRQYLVSQYQEADARKLFDIYRNYLDCEIKLATNGQYHAQTPDLRKLLDLLFRIQIFRREKMGKETADALFGGEVKEKEYFLRKEIILADPALYGKEKERGLRKLEMDMWEGSIVPVDAHDNPYNQYMSRKQMYQKDLHEADEKNRGRMIEEFRREFFSAEQMKRLREVDAQMAAEAENLKRYREAEQKILNTKNMPDTQRNEKIKALQDKFFGADADAFRRLEAIQRDLKKK
jgi:lipase chaperone LimK